MKLTCNWQPASAAMQWRLTLTLPKGTPRIVAMSRRLTIVTRLAQRGHPRAVIALAQWRQQMEALATQYDEEAIRLTQLLAELAPDYQATPDANRPEYPLPVGSEAAMVLTICLKKLDKVLFLIEMCQRTFYRQRTTFSRKNRQTLAGLKALMTSILQTRPDVLTDTRPLSDAEQARLASALNADGLPLMPAAIRHQLTQQESPS